MKGVMLCGILERGAVMFPRGMTRLTKAMNRKVGALVEVCHEVFVILLNVIYFANICG